MISVHASHSMPAPVLCSITVSTTRARSENLYPTGRFLVILLLQHRMNLERLTNGNVGNRFPSVYDMQHHYLH